MSFFISSSVTLYNPRRIGFPKEHKENRSQDLCPDTDLPAARTAGFTSGADLLFIIRNGDLMTPDTVMGILSADR